MREIRTSGLMRGMAPLGAVPTLQIAMTIHPLNLKSTLALRSDLRQL